MLRKSHLFFVVACLTLVGVLSGLGTRVHADVTPAQVSVNDITVSKTSFVAGETVTGSFLLVNDNPAVNVPDINYKISLVGNYGKDGLPATYFDTQTFGPVFISTTEVNKLVQFSYVIPKSFSGKNLGLHIRAYQSTGEPLGWNDQLISVTGGLSTASITDASVIADGKSYNLMVGPMIYQDKAGSLNITFSNTSKESLTFTPTIIIHDHSFTAPALKTTAEDTISLKAGGKQSVSYPLETFSYKPGVYVGEISFNDQDGNPRVSSFQFRYIVAGDIASISSITSPVTSIKKGETLNLTLNYAGAPYDIATGEGYNSGTTSLNVKVSNEKDQVVGNYTTSVDFNFAGTKNIPITAGVDAAALRVVATATNKDGKVVATYTTDLSPNYANTHMLSTTTSPVATDDSSPSMLYIIIPLVIIIMGIILLFIRKRIMGTFFILIVCLTFGGMSAPKAHAFTIVDKESINSVWEYFLPNLYPSTNDPNLYGYHPFTALIPWLFTNTHDFSPTVTISSPTNSTRLSPGQTFYVKGSTYAAACQNEPQDMMVAVTFQSKKLTQTYTKINEQTGAHHIQDGPTEDFSLGPFTAPSTAGTYRITFRVENYVNIPTRTVNQAARLASPLKATPTKWDTIGGYSDGYQDVIVTAPAPTVSLHANPASVNTGTASKLTWSSTNATACTSSDFTTSNAKSNSTGVSTGNLTSPKTYNIRCTGPGGAATDSVTVNINTPAPAPTATLSASPTSVTSGSNSNLTWSSTNATTCTASGGWTGSKSVASGSHSQATANITTATVYTITCTGAGGTATKSVTVNITNPPPATPDPVIVSLSVDNHTVNQGDSVTLTWTVSNATACTASGGWSGSKSSSGGTEVISNLTQNTSFTISCTGAGTPGSDSETVTVTGSGPKPVDVNITTPDDNIPSSGSATLTWTADNAASCVASSDPDGSDWNTAKNKDGGTQTISSITTDRTFNITCTGVNGDTANDSVTVHVGGAEGTTTCEAQDSTGHAITSARVGDMVYWKATVAGPVTSYDWSGSTPLAGSSNPQTVTYTVKGVKTASVDVTFADGSHEDHPCEVTLPVKEKPTFTEI